ncbi:interferon-inducible GTPase 5-like [Paroedura picta]|uniref:interferon-inducible GTPase 5-like n=1 Tax=Paroedura picta TaxID=143630 RepID=UPI004057895B
MGRKQEMPTYLLAELMAPYSTVLRRSPPRVACSQRRSSGHSRRTNMGGSITKALIREELQKLKDEMQNKNFADVIEESKSNLKLLNNTTLDIAITGVSGAGKSSLVNALMGMTDYEKDAAKVGVIETTLTRKKYTHPTFPKVTLWDLPGTGTPQFVPKKYLKDVHFEEYDFFIIVASDRFTSYDVLLAHEIQKLKKKFYYVRTKVDVSIDSERQNPNYNEEKSLEKMRTYCCDNLRDVKPIPMVFLISRRDLKLYDFPLFLQTLVSDLDGLKRDVLIAVKVSPRHSSGHSRRTNMGGSITKALIGEELQKLKDEMQNQNLADVIKESESNLKLLNNTTLDIAITGVSGVGKSSLVNALRGMTDYEKDAAETGVTETTLTRKKYTHPRFPKVTLWDLPGTGTPLFVPKKYLKDVHFEEYDFFIIVASHRFTSNDVLLAHEIQKLKKKFYYVRTKVDVSIDSERKKPNFNEEKYLEKMRTNCCDNLRDVKPIPMVFLISRWDLELYDFPLLLQTLESDMGGLKRDDLITALPAFSREVLEKKKAAMEAHIRKIARVSCVIGAIPVPGLSVNCNIGILVETMRYFCNIFGLDAGSLNRLSNRVGKPVDVLRSAIKKSPMVSQVTAEFVIDLLSKSLLCGTMMVVEMALDFIPVLGSLTGGGLSFVTTFYILKTFLHDVVEDAENVLAKAAE